MDKEQLRIEFAKSAMAAQITYQGIADKATVDQIAKQSIVMADAMIKMLDGEKVASS